MILGFFLLQRPRLSLLDRYIAFELCVPFLFGIAAFSAIGLAIGSVFDLVQKVAESGLPVAIALQVFLLQMPKFVVLSFPMSTLLTTLVVYSRLSGDSEIVALRGCGVSIYRLVLPAMALSLLVTGMTFFFNESLVPTTNHQASVVLNHVLQQDKPDLEKHIFYREFTSEQLSQIFFARRFKDAQMQDLMVLNFSPQGLRRIITAKAAAWNSTQENWNFFNGTVYTVGTDGSYQNVSKFERRQLLLSRIPLDLATQSRKSEEMNITEAQQYLRLLEQSGDQRKIRKLQLRIQEKYALPFICVVFGLVGASLGTKPQRTSSAMGFGLSVVIIFGYYLLAFVSSSLGESGTLAPWVAAWLPTALGLLAGGVLLYRAQ